MQALTVVPTTIPNTLWGMWCRRNAKRTCSPRTWVSLRRRSACKRCTVVAASGSASISLGDCGDVPRDSSPGPCRSICCHLRRLRPIAVLSRVAWTRASWICDSRERQALI